MLCIKVPHVRIGPKLFGKSLMSIRSALFNSSAKFNAMLWEAFGRIWIDARASKVRSLYLKKMSSIRAGADDVIRRQ